MGNLSWRGKANSPVLALICCITMVFTFSCMGGGGGSGDSSDSGSVSFGLAIDNSGGSRSLSGRAVEDDAVPIECSEFDISTIEAEIRNANGEIIALGGPFPCEAGEGSIEDVIPGNNYTVFIVARSGDSILFEGESEPFAVVAGELTDAGLIVLKSINARLDGDFIGTGFGFDNELFSYWSALFKADFDGSGGGNFDNLETSDGSSGGGPLTYNLDFDGSLSATLGDGTVFSGILNPDKNILAVADTDSSEDFFVEMDVVIKKSAGLSDDILNGEYIGVRIGSAPSTARILFDFAGKGSGDFTYLADSRRFTTLPSGGFDYTFLSNPADFVDILSITEPAIITSKGIVSGDGAVVSLVDTEFGGDLIDLTVLIKTSSGLSAATIDGDYVAVSFAIFTGSSGGASQATTLWNINADGAGNLEFEIIESSSSREPIEPTTYRVNVLDDTLERVIPGSIEIGPPGNPRFDGIVNAKGDVFTFVDTNDNDDLIEMGVAIKKTQ